MNDMLTPDQEAILGRWLKARKASHAAFESYRQNDKERTRAHLACADAGINPYRYLKGDDLKRYESIPGWSKNSYQNPTDPHV